MHNPKETQNISGNLIKTKGIEVGQYFILVKNIQNQ